MSDTPTAGQNAYLSSIEGLVQLNDLASGMQIFRDWVNETKIDENGDDMHGSLAFHPIALTKDNDKEISNSLKFVSKTTEIDSEKEIEDIVTEIYSDLDNNLNIITKDIINKNSEPYLNIGNLIYLMGVCETDAATEIKEIELPEVKNITNGLTINVLFTKGHSASNLKLKLNNADEAQVNYTGIADHAPALTFPANTILTFTYYNEQWYCYLGQILQYKNATEDYSGLMPKEDKIRFDNMSNQKVKYAFNKTYPSGWHTIAIGNTQSGAFEGMGTFIVQGKDSVAMFAVYSERAGLYNTGINLLSSTIVPSSATFDKIRIKFKNEMGTKNPIYLQIYIPGGQESPSYEVKLLDSIGDWQLLSEFVADGNFDGEFLEEDNEVETVEKEVLQQGGNVLNFDKTLTTGWTPVLDSSGVESGIYEQLLTIPEIKSTDEPFITINLEGAPPSTKLIKMSAWSKIFDATTEDGGITFFSLEPLTTTVPLKIKIIRK